MSKTFIPLSGVSERSRRAMLARHHTAIGQTLRKTRQLLMMRLEDVANLSYRTIGEIEEIENGFLHDRDLVHHLCVLYLIDEKQLYLPQEKSHAREGFRVNSGTATVP